MPVTPYGPDSALTSTAYTDTDREREGARQTEHRERIGTDRSQGRIPAISHTLKAFISTFGT